MPALELKVGQTATRSNTLTEEHVARYAELTGDRNPLHFDDAFVARTPFGRRVVHGGLTTGILNALVERARGSACARGRRVRAASGQRPLS